jgi:cobalt-zinc-cadmium efflux system protein
MSHDHHDHDHDEHDHHDHEGHDHHGHHGHSHAPASFGTAFAVGVALNAGFVIVEVVYGLVAHSLALVADAGHNLSDVFGLLLAWGAAVWAKRPATDRHTYGWRRSSVLAALANAMFLLASVGVIAWEAVQRFRAPAPIAAPTMIWVSALGIAINGVTAWLFMAGRKGDLNIRGAFQHMLADAMISAGVVVAGIVIMFTGWLWLDPVVSLVLVAVIVAGTWNLLCDSFNLALDAVPAGIDKTAVQKYLAALPGVADVHHLHIWGLGTTDTALTAHVVLAARTVGSEVLRSIDHE